MPREVILFQVGQCGNQISDAFWQLAFAEHFPNITSSSAFSSAKGYPSSFFYEDRKGYKNTRARAILIDLEEGVINRALSSPFAPLFDNQLSLTDSSGAGNNWSVGFHEYGNKYAKHVLELTRRSLEKTDSVESFIFVHSIGGGTGSGFGSRLVETIAEEYPSIFKLCCSVFPSKDDDVITSPYNRLSYISLLFSLFALSKLIQHADVVLPLHNQALYDISERLTEKKAHFSKSAIDDLNKKKAKPFGLMNIIASRLLLDLTSSIRFEGSLNVDLNEITMNLVPFPGIHFLSTSLSSPLPPPFIQPRKFSQTFTDLFSSDFQLSIVQPKAGQYLACALMVRGIINLNEVMQNIRQIQSKISFVEWNSTGWKLGHCATPPSNQRQTMLCLANNCAIDSVFEEMLSRFNVLYKHKAHLHHYTTYMSQDDFSIARETVKMTASMYKEISTAKCKHESFSLIV